MNDFIETTVGAQVVLQRGVDITKKEQQPGDVPVISSGGISSLHNAAISREPGVILGRKGSIGTVYYSAGPYWPEDTTLWVKDFKGNDPKFVYYFFRWFAPKLASMDVGSSNPTLNRNHIYPLPIRWPRTLVQQLEISSVLQTFDLKIDANSRIVATLEDIAQTIFRSWFVDFDPVHARVKAIAEGRDPERACMAAITGRSAEEIDALSGEQLKSLTRAVSVFPDELAEGTPVGWKTGVLSQLCNLNESSWNDRSLPETVEYVDLANARHGELNEVQSFSRKEAPTRARRRLRTGDIIVGTVRPANRSFAIFGETERELTGSTGFAVLTPKSASLREVVYIVATSDSNINRLAHLADGGAYPAVRPEEVVKAACVVATESAYDAYHELAGPMFDLILQKRRENGLLETLRDTLLPPLISGSIQIPDSASIA